MASSMVSNSFSLCIGLSSKCNTRVCRVIARSASGGPDPSIPPLKIANYPIRPGRSEQTPEKLEALWDDGFGKVSSKDYIDASKDIICRDGGPPRWFCPVECGQPLKDSPVLLFLPGNGWCLVPLFFFHFHMFFYVSMLIDRY